MSDPALPFECQPGETAKAFAAFVVFRDLGPERSVLKVLWIVEEVYGSKMTMDGMRSGDEERNRMDLVGGAMDLQRRHHIELWDCDPAEPRNIERFRRADLRARKADNRVMLGIAAVNARIKTGRLRVFRGCQNLIHESGLYRWPTPQSCDKCRAWTAG